MAARGLVARRDGAAGSRPRRRRPRRRRRRPRGAAGPLPTTILPTMPCASWLPIGQYQLVGAGLADVGLQRAPARPARSPRSRPRRSGPRPRARGRSRRRCVTSNLTTPGSAMLKFAGSSLNSVSLISSVCEALPDRRLGAWPSVPVPVVSVPVPLSLVKLPSRSSSPQAARASAPTRAVRAKVTLRFTRRILRCEAWRLELRCRGYPADLSAGSSNGKTPASGAGYRGSSPCPAARVAA